MTKKTSPLVQTIMSRIISVFPKYHCTPTFQLFIQHCQTLVNHSFDFCSISVKHLFKTFQHCSTFEQILTLPLAATWNLFLAIHSLRHTDGGNHLRRSHIHPISFTAIILILILTDNFRWLGQDVKEFHRYL